MEQIEIKADSVPVRKRRAAVRPALRDLSDSEDEIRHKRSRKNLLDDDYCQPDKEPSKRSQSQRATKPSSTRPKLTIVQKQARPPRSRQIVEKRTIDQDIAINDPNPEERGEKDINYVSKFSKGQNKSEKSDPHAQRFKEVSDEEMVQDSLQVSCIFILTLSSCGIVCFLKPIFPNTMTVPYFVGLVVTC